MCLTLSRIGPARARCCHRCRRGCQAGAAALNGITGADARSKVRKALMWTLSGFADEISPDLDEQVALVTELGLRFIELRSVWDMNVLDLDGDQLRRVRRALDARRPRRLEHRLADRQDRRSPTTTARTWTGCGTPLEVAQFFDAPVHPDVLLLHACGRRPRRLPRRGDRPHRATWPRIAEDAGVTLIHENEKEIFGDIPRRCLDIVESVDSPALAADLGQRQLRPVRRPPVHRGLRRCSPRTWSTCR